MNVAEIMTPNPITVQSTTPVEEVARLLLRHQISGAPVLDARGAVIGMVTEDDLIVRNANLHLPTFLNFLDGFFPVRGEHEFEEELRRITATAAGEVMSEHLYAIAAEADVADAATLMHEKGANPLPVISNGRLVGIVARADIIRLMVRQEEAAERVERAEGR